MKVAIVHPYPANAGKELQGSAIIHRDRAVGTLLQDLGHTVKGFRSTTGAGGTVATGDEYLDWTYYPVDEKASADRRSEVRSRALEEELDRWSPDFLIVKGAGTALGSELGRALQVPMAVIIGGNHSDRQLATCDLVLTETPDQEEFLRRRMGSGRLLRLPKLASPSFHEDPSQAQFEFDIAVVSKFERHKNHEALTPLFDREISMVLVGDGALQQYYEDYARTRVADVTFTGFVGAEEVAQALRKSQILVHPSLSEGFPRAVVEGMASGTPAVCLSGVVGWPLVDRENGRIVSESDLVGAAIELIGDRTRLADLQRGAFETSQREFSVEALRRTTDELNRRMVEAVANFNGRKSWRYKAARARFTAVDTPRATTAQLSRYKKRLKSLRG